MVSMGGWQMKNLKFGLVLLVLFSILVLSGCDESPDSQIDITTGVRAGYSIVDSGISYDVFECRDFSYGVSQLCTVRVSKPCTTAYCIRNMCIYEDQLHIIEQPTSSSTTCVSGTIWDGNCRCRGTSLIMQCDGHRGYIVTALNYTCPGFNWHYNPAGGGLQSVSRTTPPYTGLNSGYIISEWVEVPYNSIVYAQGAKIEWNKQAYFTCEQYGLPKAGVPYCEGRSIYQWIDRDGDGCGGGTSDERYFTGVVCPMGTECIDELGCVAEGCHSGTEGKIECVDSKTERTCKFHQTLNLYYWVEKSCVGDATCVAGQGCVCVGKTPCPIGVTPGQYICNPDGSYQRCISEGGCTFLSNPQFCGSGQICQLKPDRTQFPCDCSPHIVNNQHCDSANIGSQMCVTNTMGVREIYECKLDTTSSTELVCPVWQKITTCDIGQNCIETTQLGNRKFECTCPDGMCAKDSRGCFSSTEEWFCQVTLGSSCGTKVGLSCQPGFSCIEGQGCQCVNECPYEGAVGCKPERNSLGVLEYYPAKCMRHTYTTPEGGLTHCHYWLPMTTSTCEQQRMFCDMDIISSTYGTCIPPFTVTFSSPSNFKYPLAGRFEFKTTLSRPIGNIRLADALVLVEVVKNKDSTSSLGSCSWTSATNLIHTCTIAQGLTGISDGNYLARVHVKISGIEYGPFYQEIIFGNAITLYPLDILKKVQYTNEPIQFGVEMRYPNNAIVPETDIVTWDARYRVDNGPWRQMGFPVYSAGGYMWTFTESSAGKLDIEVKPQMKTADFVVDTYTYDRITLARPRIIVDMLSPSTYPHAIDQHGSVTFEWQCLKSGSNEPIPCTVKVANMHQPDGQVKNVLHLVRGSGSKYSLTYKFDQTPSYHFEVRAEATGFIEGISCPADLSGGTYMGCPISVGHNPGSTWIYFVIGFVVLLLIFLIIRRGRKGGGRRR